MSRKTMSSFSFFRKRTHFIGFFGVRTDKHLKIHKSCSFFSVASSVLAWTLLHCACIIRHFVCRDFECDMRFPYTHVQISRYVNSRILTLGFSTRSCHFLTTMMCIVKLTDWFHIWFQYVCIQPIRIIYVNQIFEKKTKNVKFVKVAMHKFQLYVDRKGAVDNLFILFFIFECRKIQKHEWWDSVVPEW